MPSISLGTLRDYWKNVSDWVTGVSSSQPIIRQTKSLPVTGTLQNAATANGNGTEFVVDGCGVAKLQITGTFNATVSFQGSVDGINFVSIPAKNIETGLFVSSTTTAGIFEIDCKGLQIIRTPISNYVSGSVTVVGRAVPLSVNHDIKLTGSYATMRIPVVGVKTVTAIATEIFAGSSRLVGRRKMILKNEDSVLRFRVGPSTVTQQNGFPVEPGAVIELDFDPQVDVPVYTISEGANLSVAVMEI